MRREDGYTFMWGHVSDRRVISIPAAWRELPRDIIPGRRRRRNCADSSIVGHRKGGLHYRIGRLRRSGDRLSRGRRVARFGGDRGLRGRRVAWFGSDRRLRGRRVARFRGVRLRADPLPLLLGLLLLLLAFLFGLLLPLLLLALLLGLARGAVWILLAGGLRPRISRRTEHDDQSRDEKSPKVPPQVPYCSHNSATLL